MTFPLGGQPAGEHAAPARDRRTVIALLVVLAAVAVLAGAYLLLSGGGSQDDTASSTAVTRPSGTRTPTASPTATPGPAVAPVLENLPQARNPFKALYTAPAAAGDGGTTSTTGTTGTAPTGGSPAAPPTTRPPTGTGGSTYAPLPVPVPSTPKPLPSTPTPAPSPTKPPTATYRLTLLDIAAKGNGPRVMTWTVDGKEVTVVRGQRFGSYGELTVLSIRATATSEEAVLQVGVGDPLTVAVGQTVTVTGPAGGL